MLRATAVRDLSQKGLVSLNLEPIADHFGRKSPAMSFAGLASTTASNSAPRALEPSLVAAMEKRQRRFNQSHTGKNGCQCFFLRSVSFFPVFQPFDGKLCFWPSLMKPTSL